MAGTRGAGSWKEGVARWAHPRPAGRRPGPWEGRLQPPEAPRCPSGLRAKHCPRRPGALASGFRTAHCVCGPVGTGSCPLAPCGFGLGPLHLPPLLTSALHGMQTRSAAGSMDLALLWSALPSAHCVPGSVPALRGERQRVYISPTSCIPSIPSFLTHQCPLSFVGRRWGEARSQAHEARDVPEWYPGSGKAAPHSIPLTHQGRCVQRVGLRIVQGATSEGMLFTLWTFLLFKKTTF